MKKTAFCLLLAFLSVFFFACAGKTDTTENDTKAYTDTAPEIITESEVPVTETDAQAPETETEAETSALTAAETEADTETEAEEETETSEDTGEAAPSDLYADVYGYIGRYESEIPAEELRESGFICDIACEYANLPKGQIFALEFSENFIPSERTSEKKSLSG